MPLLTCWDFPSAGAINAFAALSPVVALPRQPLLCWAAKLCACTRTVHSSRQTLPLDGSAHFPGILLGTDTRARLQKPGFHVTNWHSDLRMTPLDTNDFVTAWIPLRRIQVGLWRMQSMPALRCCQLCISPVASLVQGSGDSCLSFASRSHRDFALPFWRHAGLKDMDLSTRGYKITSTGACSPA